MRIIEKDGKARRSKQGNLHEVVPFGAEIMSISINGKFVNKICSERSGGEVVQGREGQGLEEHASIELIH